MTFNFLSPRKPLPRLSLIAFIFLVLCTACGGGGGGGSDSGSSDTEISPDVIMTGGLAFVSVNFHLSDFDDLDTQGLTIKLLIPSEFGFVNGASSLTLDRGAVPFGPHTIADAPRKESAAILNDNGVEIKITPTSEGAFSFYVFSIPAATLHGEDEGELQMTFNVGSVPANSVLFTDVDRGETSTFDPNNSDFDAESMTEFNVERPSLIDEDEANN